MGIFDSARNLFSKGEQGDNVRVDEPASAEQPPEQPQAPVVPEEGGEATAKVREFAAEIAETTRSFAHDVMAHIDSEIAAAGAGTRTYRTAGSAPELVFAEEALVEEESAVEAELADGAGVDADVEASADADAGAEPVDAEPIAAELIDAELIDAEIAEQHDVIANEVLVDEVSGVEVTDDDVSDDAVSDDDVSDDAVSDDDVSDDDVSDDTVLTPIVSEEIAYVSDAVVEDDEEDTVLDGDDLRDNGDTIDLSELRLTVELPEDIAPDAADNADTPDVLEQPDEPALTFDQLLGGVSTQTQQLNIPTGTPEPEDGPDDETLNWELPSANSTAPTAVTASEQHTPIDEEPSQKKGKSSRKAKQQKQRQQDEGASENTDTDTDADDFDNLFGDLLK